VAKRWPDGSQTIQLASQLRAVLRAYCGLGNLLPRMTPNSGHHSPCPVLDAQHG
jgi:hypothetical protein